LRASSEQRPAAPSRLSLHAGIRAINRFADAGRPSAM
jgi:hypothetical protein